jgi:phospholipase C
MGGMVESQQELQTTAIPLRVLNNALQQFVGAVGLTIRLDGDDSEIAVSQDLVTVTGITIEPIRFSVPGVRDVNLQTLGVFGRRGANGAPVLQVFIDFETQGVEIGLRGVDLVDITTASIMVDLELQTHGEPGDRGISPLATITTNIDTDLNPVISFIALLFGIDVDDVIDIVRQNVERMLNSSLYLEAVGKFLTAGFVQVAQRGDEFHEIRAEEDRFLVVHFDPEATADTPEDGVVTPLPKEIEETAGDRAPLDPVALANLDKINHIVVLMQENRSFDHLLGYLSLPLEAGGAGRADVDGLTGEESNTTLGVPVQVNPLADRFFPFDPAHNFEEVMAQIADGEMSGFLQSFVERFPGLPLTGPERKTALSFYTGDQLPTFQFLIQNYLVCDRWFSALPGPTQPNRFCELSGFTPELNNYLVVDPEIGYVGIPTIFEHLTAEDWVYYEKDIAFLRFYDRYRLDDRNVIPFADRQEGFVAKAAAGQLPKVTIIDPNFVDLPPLRTADDDHPPADIQMGQESIACIYNALVDSPHWEETLFVITYDEHGGFFDHVPPPGTSASEETPVSAVPPVHPDGPPFFGVRVPTFVISPWVDSGALSHVTFDHIAIAKTILLKLLGPDLPQMSARLARAGHLGTVLTRTTPRTDKPKVDVDIPCLGPRPLPPPPEIQPGMHPALMTSLEPTPDDFHETMRRFGQPVIAH